MVGSVVSKMKSFWHKMSLWHSVSVPSCCDTREGGRRPQHPDLTSYGKVMWNPEVSF